MAEWQKVLLVLQYMWITTLSFQVVHWRACRLIQSASTPANTARRLHPSAVHWERVVSSYKVLVLPVTYVRVRTHSLLYDAAMPYCAVWLATVQRPSPLSTLTNVKRSSTFIRGSRGLAL